MSDLLNGISIFHQLQSFEYSGLHPIGFFQERIKGSPFILSWIFSMNDDRRSVPRR